MAGHTDLSVGEKSRVRGRAILDRRLGIDARALATFRVTLGILLITDLLLRSRHLVAFYTDVGVLPRSTLFVVFPGARFSIHAAAGAPWVQAVLFLVAAGFALALLVGYHTRLVTVVSLLLLASLHARNPFVLNGGDVLLRRLLFWGVFLPLGARWSLDARGEGEPRGRVTSVASAALLVQVVIVYTVTGLFKLRGTRWEAGTFLESLFYADQLTVFLGDVIVTFPGLLRALTWLWLGMVLSSSLLIVLTGWARILLVSMFIVMHLGMLATMQLGLFPLISITALLPFLPGPVWDAAEAVPSHTGTPRVRHATVVKRHAVEPLRHLVRLRGRDWGWSGIRIERLTPPGQRSTTTTVPPRFEAVVVGGLLVSMLLWNGMGLGHVATPDSIASVRDPADHRWDMFARGQRDAGWFVVPGRLESGRRVDAFQMAPVEWDRPPDLARTYPSARWLRYSVALRSDDTLQQHFAAYLCWRWNAQHGDALVALTVYYNKIPVSLDGPGEIQRVELLKYSCPIA